MKKKTRNKHPFFDHYRQSWNYLVESRKFIFSVIALFFAFSLFGFFVPAPDFLDERIIEFIRNLVEKTRGMSYPELTGFILFNNLKSSFFGMIYGALLGIFPVIAASANGYLLGFVASASVKSEGILVLWRLLPHGVFELPAIFISLGLGLKTGSFIFQKDKFKSLKAFFWNSFKVFVLIVIPLLIIAAVIEGTLISFFK